MFPVCAVTVKHPGRNKNACIHYFPNPKKYVFISSLDA